MKTDIYWAHMDGCSFVFLIDMHGSFFFQAEKEQKMTCVKTDGLI